MEEGEKGEGKEQKKEDPPTHQHRIQPSKRRECIQSLLKVILPLLPPLIPLHNALPHPHRLIPQQYLPHLPRPVLTRDPCLGVRLGREGSGMETGGFDEVASSAAEGS